MGSLVWIPGVQKLAYVQNHEREPTEAENEVGHDFKLEPTDISLYDPQTSKWAAMKKNPLISGFGSLLNNFETHPFKLIRDMKS